MQTENNSAVSQSNLCSFCGNRKLDQEERESLEQFIETDMSIDGGEFSSSFDYYQGICGCCPHGVNLRERGFCDTCEEEYDKAYRKDCLE